MRFLLVHTLSVHQASPQASSDSPVSGSLPSHYNKNVGVAGMLLPPDLCVFWGPKLRSSGLHCHHVSPEPPPNPLSLHVSADVQWAPPGHTENLRSDGSLQDGTFFKISPSVTRGSGVWLWGCFLVLPLGL